MTETGASTPIHSSLASPSPSSRGRRRAAARAPSAPLVLADDQMCYGCGRHNRQGLHLTFEFDPDRQHIRTHWTPRKVHQGYADIVHGGITTLVLDELMGNLLWKLQRPAVTAELTTRFRRPIRVGQPLACEAWVAESSRGGTGRVIFMEAVAKSAAGTVMASATARCVRIGDGGTRDRGRT